MSIAHHTPHTDNSVRDIDPNVLQRRASDPHCSVWVNASAGTGKTKVLTDRVLRLLLPRSNGDPATPPYKILCLTFTKAGANEMTQRIYSILSRWSILSETELYRELENLQGSAPSPEQIQKARTLFSLIIDSPESMKIMTIHAFCQSLLGKFPLEAGMNPDISIIEEDTAKQFKEAGKLAILRKPSPHISQAILALSPHISENRLDGLINDIMSERRAFTNFIKQFDTHEHLYNHFCTQTGLDPQITEQSLKELFTKERPVSDLKALSAELIEASAKTDINFKQMLDTCLNDNAYDGDDYSLLYLTKDGAIRKKILTQKALKQSALLEEFIQNEAEKVLEFQNRLKLIKSVQITYNIFILAQDILGQYEAIKKQNAVLDFDDLILRSLSLLEDRSMAQWVQFKMDQGLDHILVDEAQDTNPEQWGIIRSLCDDFSSGQSHKEDVIRTIFVVGDEKQSIYSFQRAAPEEFEYMRGYFKNKAIESGQKWQDIELNISFRSTRTVLNFVDNVFNQPHVQKGVSAKTIEHKSFRRGQAGYAEFWPLLEPQEDDSELAWVIPDEIISNKDSTAELANMIAKEIHSWITGEKLLPSHDRAVHPDDIMILFRTRNALSFALLRALRSYNIPVKGSDRLRLQDHIANRDIIALADFALMPHDDYTLACLLKSPFIGLTEDDLFLLAHNREGSLWDRICADRAYQKTADYLQNIIRKSMENDPYTFLQDALQRPCPAHERSALQSLKTRLGADCEDAVQLLLSQALLFQSKPNVTLQSFIHAIKNQTETFSASMDETSGHIRLMTVHASKGLQAPIVILPDTIRASRTVAGQTDKTLLWPHKTSLKVPLCCLKKNDRPLIFEQALQETEERLDEEYRRLLYVAMTRAEDMLYIAGHTKKKTPIEDSWHSYIKSSIDDDSGDTYIMQDPQIHEPDKRSSGDAETKKDTNQQLPQWAYKDARQESTPKNVRASSKDDKSVTSPLDYIQEHNRFLKGDITHKLLQILPGLPADQQESSAKSYIDHAGKSLTPQTQNDILMQVLKIIREPQYQFMFTPQAKAEIPISGVIDGDHISGQIDLLVIEDDTVWIIDYKTETPPADITSNIPPAYKRQLAQYALLIKDIYPAHKINKAILWTQTGQISHVE